MSAFWKTLTPMMYMEAMNRDTMPRAHFSRLTVIGALAKSMKGAMTPMRNRGAAITAGDTTELPTEKKQTPAHTHVGVVTSVPGLVRKVLSPPATARTTTCGIVLAPNTVS